MSAAKQDPTLSLLVQGDGEKETRLAARCAPEWTTQVWLSELWKDRPETILQLAEMWLNSMRDPQSWEADLQILEPRVTKNQPAQLFDFQLQSAEGRRLASDLLQHEPFLGLSRLSIAKGALNGKSIPVVVLVQTTQQSFHKPALLDASFLMGQVAEQLAAAEGGPLDRRSLARFACNAAQIQLLLQRALIGHKDLLNRWMRHLSQQPESHPVAQRMRAARAILGPDRDDVDYAMALSLTLIGPGGLNQALHHLDAYLRAA